MAGSILGKLSKNPALLVQELDRFEEILEEKAPVLELDGKKLESLCKEHPQNVFFFRKKAYELKCIEEIFITKRDKIFSEHWKKLNENNKKILSQKDIGTYIQAEPDYIDAHELVLEIQYIRKKFDSVCEALDAMGYALNNITKIRIAELEDIII